MIPVTLIVTTRNEELNIVRCLQSAADFIEQIYVIDSESTDETVSLARPYAEVVNLPYDHAKIIPWIYQWALDHLPIRHEWVMILEADQAITPALRRELEALFAHNEIAENGFYIRRRQIFRGQELRFGGYGSKYMLKLFRRTAGELDPEETDTRVYVKGRTAKLKAALIEDNQKENEILFYLQKHLRYAETFAREELQRRQRGMSWKLKPRLFGTPDERTLWLKTRFFALPLYLRPFVYFFYRYVVLLGFLDGKQGSIFHFLQAFWFRLVWDIRLEEMQQAAQANGQAPPEKPTPTPLASLPNPTDAAAEMPPTAPVNHHHEEA
ncbi:MAG: glycosyltransferase family 2 protein [Acidobacteria bacterium]|nr:glycosyltransferase family 2 protein [Acidobacteriota bacterium]